MQFTGFGATIAALGLSLTVFAPADAAASSRSRSAAGAHAAVHGRSFEAGARSNVRAIRFGMAHGRYASAASYGGGGGGGGYGYGGRLQCVPFARENTGIELSGNAATWWANADGVYAKGARPEVGSVLNFRANGRMRLGHVAVVSNVIDSRNIQIDHANWAGPGSAGGGVSRNVTVVDVSERNDWTAVRVSLGRGGEFGSVYPTYGFIYDRADTGVMTANNGVVPTAATTTGSLALNAAPQDLRPAAEQVQQAGDVEEVAEAEDEPRVRYGRQGRGGRAVRMAHGTESHGFGGHGFAGRGAGGHGFSGHGFSGQGLSGRAVVQRVSVHGTAAGGGRSAGHGGTPARRHHF